MPELFQQGTLEMSTTPLESAAQSVLWGDVTVNRVAVIAVLVLLVVEIYDIIHLVQPLLRCVPFWKANVELEHSVSMARTRNTVSFVCGLAFCVVASRFSLLSPSWMAAIPAQWHLAVTTGLLFGFVLLRSFLYLLTPLRSSSSEFSSSVRHAFYNYTIIFVLLALLSTLVLVAARVPQGIVRVILTVEAAILYLLDIRRTAQILSSRYGVFPTILYLCALELLPAGILILTCTQ